MESGVCSKGQLKLPACRGIVSGFGELRSAQEPSNPQICKAVKINSGILFIRKEDTIG